MSELAGEFYGIEQFAPTRANLELLRQIDLSLVRVNEARDRGSSGLPTDVLNRIEEDFLIDRVRDSATIEGSNLDRRETVLVLTTGQIVEGKRKSSQETRNLGKALRTIANRPVIQAIDLPGLLDIHVQLMDGLDDQAGRFRTGRVMLSGAKYQPPSADRVPGLVQSLLEALLTSPLRFGGFTTGVYAHWMFARIHPFRDGNGRMARILQDWIFLQNRLVPVPIPYALADEYYAALQAADGGHPARFFEFVALCALKSLARYQAALNVSREGDEWIGDLAESAVGKQDLQETAKFWHWFQRMSEFRETMSLNLDKLRLRLPMFEIIMRQFGPLDLQGFRQLRTHATVAPMRDFWLEFRDPRQSVTFVFNYEMWPNEDFIKLDDVPVLTPLLLQGDEFHNLDQCKGETISLRGIGLQTGEFVRVRRFDFPLGLQCDAPLDAQTICREFIQDVLRIHFAME